MILCLHDFDDFWFGWRNQLKALSHSSWVVALDMKGFGDSEKPFIASKYKDEVLVEELKQFIDILKPGDKKIVLIGHGLGGQVAWKFVEKYPSMVSKFISISSPHPRVWLMNATRSWRSVMKNRWLYTCRIPFLPEMEMIENDVEVFDKKFKNSSTVMNLNNYSDFDKVRLVYEFSNLHTSFSRRLTSTHSLVPRTGRDQSTTSGTCLLQNQLFSRIMNLNSQYQWKPCSWLGTWTLKLAWTWYLSQQNMSTGEF